MKDENTDNENSDHENSDQRPIAGYCEVCQSKLYGELMVESEIIEGIGIISIKEVSERNWILCDGCNALLCHNCCLQPHTGLCNACYNRMEKDGGFSPIRMLLLMSAPQPQETCGKGED
ncbi:MAG: hypothetical protein M3209_17605 [Acidobacteriota bacterium]|nr:hypothetical protein [Acidobacteriota bacterium]